MAEKSAILILMKHLLLVLTTGIVVSAMVVAIMLVIFASMNYYSTKAICETKGGVMTNDGYCISKTVIISVP